MERVEVLESSSRSDDKELARVPYLETPFGSVPPRIHEESVQSQTIYFDAHRELHP